ncbi:hypothetical protein EVAR_43076_1 [Eumeta japonica]|uniref:Uncharacterized protein n=1 Tax=Eumeta variegata TaxID=151549 RepID=A0A4C1WVG0_EUMVA|nr:hypothetical protein EVAR_43076_1 [Eumeta japonica]
MGKGIGKPIYLIALKPPTLARHLKVNVDQGSDRRFPEGPIFITLLFELYPSARAILALGHPSNQSDIIYIHNKWDELFFPNLLELDIHANQDIRQDESNEPKLGGVASFNYGVPIATFQLHHQTLVTI